MTRKILDVGDDNSPRLFIKQIKVTEPILKMVEDPSRNKKWFKAAEIWKEFSRSLRTATTKEDRDKAVKLFKRGIRHHRCGNGYFPTTRMQTYIRNILN